jgi:hypothetical protein
MLIHLPKSFQSKESTSERELTRQLLLRALKGTTYGKNEKYETSSKWYMASRWHGEGGREGGLKWSKLGKWEGKENTAPLQLLAIAILNVSKLLFISYNKE